MDSSQPPVQWVTGLFPGVKRPGRDVDQPLYLVPWLKKEYSYTSSAPLGLYDTVMGRIFFLRFYLIKTYIHSARYQYSSEEYITSNYTITLQL